MTAPNETVADVLAEMRNSGWPSDAENWADRIDRALRGAVAETKRADALAERVKVTDAMVERAAKAVAEDWQKERVSKTPWELLNDEQKAIALDQVRVVIAALKGDNDA